MRPQVTLDPSVPFRLDERSGTVTLLAPLPKGTRLRISHDWPATKARRAARAVNLRLRGVATATAQAPAGLEMLREGVSWQQADRSLAEMADDLKAKAEAARRTAEQARERGDLVRWRRFSDVARSYSVALYLLGAVRVVG